MKICVDCFADTDFRARIISLNKKEKCDIHHKVENIFDTNIDTQLNIQTDLVRLLDQYETVEYGKDEDFTINEALKAKTLIDRLESDWGIFSKNLSENDKSKLISELLKDSFDFTKDPIFRLPLRMKKISNNQFAKKHSILLGDSWNSFKNNIRYKNRFFNKDLDVGLLADIMGFSVIELKKGMTLFRARIVDNFSEIKGAQDMLIPPSKIINKNEGRLNPRGIGMLYLASSPEVALKEVRAAFNDNVVIAPITLKNKIKVVDLTQIDHLSPFNMLDNTLLQSYQLNKEIISTLVHELEKPVKSNPTNLDYLPTQYLSSIVQTRYMGIKYKSTMVDYKSNNFNIVLFNDSDVQVNMNQLKKRKVDKVNYHCKQI